VAQGWFEISWPNYRFGTRHSANRSPTAVGTWIPYGGFRLECPKDSDGGLTEMLGHAKLTTTELYTRVSINLLKQVYSPPGRPRPRSCWRHSPQVRRFDNGLVR
jgi:hypothetical protein